MIDSFVTVAMMGGAGAPQGGGSQLTAFLPMIVIFGIFYFMLIRPQQRKEKERRRMIDEIKSGARVMFCGGILGTVVNVKETTFLVKIADNVKIEVARAAVSKVIEKGEKAVAEDA